MARARWLLAVLLALTAVSQSPVRAQTNVTKAALPPDRYLLIVETSKSMQRRADAVLGIVQDMLMSGLNGQFRDGGTLGVWTFNEDLSAGRFPMQVWSSSTKQDITRRALTFLKGQKYEKQANFDKVAPALGRVISDSRRLTVVLISGGDWKMRGTPFDDRINESFQHWQEQQQKARMPFVTILCARKGQVGAYAVNTPPWPLQVPQLAALPKSIQTTNRQPLTARHNVTTSTVAPLIISGRKPQPEPVSVPKPEPVVALAAAPPLVAAVAVTNPPTTVKLPEPVPPPAEVANAQPAPVVHEKPAAEQPPKVVTVPTPASEPKLEPVKASEPKEAELASAKPLPTPPAAEPMPKPEPVAVEQPKHTAAPEVKPVPAPAPIPIPEPRPIAIPSAARVQATTTNLSSLAPPPSSRPALAAPAPAPAAIAEPRPVAIPSATTAQATATNPSLLPPPPSSRPAPPVETATVAPAESLMRTRNILIAAVLLAVVAVGLVFLLMRRSRAAPQGSLITRSFEREKGP